MFLHSYNHICKEIPKRTFSQVTLRVSMYYYAHTGHFHTIVATAILYRFRITVNITH